METCSLSGCPGTYEARQITHTMRVRGQVVVIDHVPAKVCDICGDTLLSLDTVRQLHALLRDDVSPEATAPLYEFASLAAR